MTDFMIVIELYLAYLLLGLLVRFILSFFPTGIRAPFELLGELRRKLIMFTHSIFGTTKNFEVNVLAIFIVPFIPIFFLYSTFVVITLMNTEFQIVNVWIFILIMFFLAFVPPAPEDMRHFIDNNPISIFIFLSKIFFVLQLVYSSELPYTDFVSIFILFFPLSSLYPSDVHVDKEIFVSSS